MKLQQLCNKNWETPRLSPEGKGISPGRGRGKQTRRRDGTVKFYVVVVAMCDMQRGVTAKHSAWLVCCIRLCKAPCTMNAWDTGPIRRWYHTRWPSEICWQHCVRRTGNCKIITKYSISFFWLKLNYSKHGPVQPQWVESSVRSFIIWIIHNEWNYKSPASLS